MRKILAAFIALSAAGAWNIAARAQDATSYPTHPISLVVAYPPGGPPDLVARIIAPAIGKALGQNVIVENKAGAGGIIGFADVARATPDGYTLVLADLSMVVDPLVYARTGYDPKKDFAWIAPVTRSYMTMLVNPSFPGKTVADFIAMAKAQPDQLRVGTSGVGSPPYLGALAFSNAAGIKLQEVPYRGIALAVSDLIAQRLSVVWMSVGPAIGQVKGGLLRVLGVYGKQRLASLPDVPTFFESGIRTGAADNGNWLGIAAPAGTPKEIVAKVNAAVNAAIRDKDVQERLASANYVNSDGGTPEEQQTIIEDSMSYWTDMFAKAGVKPE